MHFLTLLLLPVLFSTSEGLSISHRHHHKHVTTKLLNGQPSATPTVPAGQNSTSPTAPAGQPSTSPTVPTGQNSGNTAPNLSLNDAVFPCGRGVQSWTTVEGAAGALPISDTTFRPTKDIKTLTHNTVTAPGPNAKPAMEAVFPQGSWSLRPGSTGGFSFYSPGPLGVDLTVAKEATFSYSVMFQNGWQWNMGGKLPGFYGGDNDQIATTCSGGQHASGCWSARLMWREAGAGEVYTYLPPGFAENNVQCNVAPYSTCNPTYGASVGRGAFHFQPGQWTTVSQRVRLNDAGQANGEIQLFVDGQSVINVSGLVLCDSPAGRFRGIQIQTFFGGSTAAWASPQDQSAYFSDFSVAIIETF